MALGKAPLTAVPKDNELIRLADSLCLPSIPAPQAGEAGKKKPGSATSADPARAGRAAIIAALDNPFPSFARLKVRPGKTCRLPAVIPRGGRGLFIWWRHSVSAWLFSFHKDWRNKVRFDTDEEEKQKQKPKYYLDSGQCSRDHVLIPAIERRVLGR